MLPRPRMLLLAALLVLTVGVLDHASTAARVSPGNEAASVTTPAVTGGGPDIALGTVAGNKVPVNAVTTATVPYFAFNLHIAANVGAGVVLNSIRGDFCGTPDVNNDCPDGSVLLTDFDGSGGPDPGSISCVAADWAVNEKVFACVTLGKPILPKPALPPFELPRFETTASGLLARFNFNATGNGCIKAHLVDLPASDPNADSLDTFTVTTMIGTTGVSQDNNVNTAPVNILIGTGTTSDCRRRRLRRPSSC